MGQLIHVSTITNPEWYFEDTYRDGYSSTYRFKWPSPQYPHRTYIHFSKLNGGRGPTRVRCDVRKWIEKNTQSTVMYDYADKSYRWYYARKWDDYYEIENQWLGLHFEEETDLLAFSIAFGDYVSPMTIYHPEYPEHEAKLLKRYDKDGRYYDRDNDFEDDE